MPVPVTVGFYAPFGCRLHMMLDKITGEALCVLGEVGVREPEALVPAQLQATPSPAHSRGQLGLSPDSCKSVLTRFLLMPTASVSMSLLIPSLASWATVPSPPLPDPCQGITQTHLISALAQGLVPTGAPTDRG